MTNKNHYLPNWLIQVLNTIAMKTDNLLEVSLCCINYNVETSFISSLHQNGLLKIITISETAYIELSELKQLEQIIRLHNDLDINLEGIETIMHLLRRVHTLQEELVILQNKLRIYENHPLTVYRPLASVHRLTKV